MRFAARLVACLLFVIGAAALVLWAMGEGPPRLTLAMMANDLERGLTCPGAEAASLGALRNTWGMSAAEIRAFAETVDNRCDRAAYMNWALHGESMAIWYRRRAAEDARAAEAAKRMPKPGGRP